MRLAIGTSELPALPIELRPGDVTVLVPAALAPDPEDPDARLDDAVNALAAAVPPTGDGSTLILVPDRTRAFPLARVLPALLDGLCARGHAAESLTMMVASGTHRGTDEDVAPARLGALPAGVRVVTHDPDAPSTLVGTTPGGTPVRVNPELLAHARVLALSGTA